MEGSGMDDTRGDQSVSIAAKDDAAAPSRSPAEDLRNAFCGRLRKRIGRHRYTAWFEGAVDVTVTATTEASELLLTTASAFEQTLVRKQLQSDIDSAACETLGESATVRYTVSEAAEPTKRAESRTDKPQATVAPQRPALSDPLAGWVLGDGNRPATTFCRRLISGERTASPALIWGPAGVGKTHLLRAIAEGVRARDKKRRVVAVEAEQFLNDFVGAIRGGGLPSFRLKYRSVDLLLIDDVQLLIGKKRTVEELRQTLDALPHGAQVVLTADRGPTGLADFGPELISRLAGGVAIEAPLPDVETRRRLVIATARRVDLELPERVATVLATRLAGGAREVQGAINRMALLHETFASPLDEQLATQVAEDSNRLSTPPVRLADIQKAVCGVFGVDSRTLRSDKRTKSVTEPRMLAMWLARRMTGSPWSEIGDFFGRRSHSTVISAHRRVESLLASPNPTQLRTGELGETIRRIEAALRTA